MILDIHSMTHWRSCSVARAFCFWDGGREAWCGGMFEAALAPNGVPKRARNASLAAAHRPTLRLCYPKHRMRYFRLLLTGRKRRTGKHSVDIVS